MVNSATELNKQGILQVKFAEVHVVSFLASSKLELLVKCGTKKLCKTSSKYP